jgi:hypothetical protein
MRHAPRIALWSLAAISRTNMCGKAMTVSVMTRLHEVHAGGLKSGPAPTRNRFGSTARTASVAPPRPPSARDMKKKLAIMKARNTAPCNTLVQAVARMPPSAVYAPVNTITPSALAHTGMRPSDTTSTVIAVPFTASTM